MFYIFIQTTFFLSQALISFGYPSQHKGRDLPALSGSNYKFVGEEVELTCVLNQKALDNNFTAGDIFFMHYNITAYSQRQCIPPSFVHIVNTTTSTLRLPNVTLANAGEYSCYVDTLPCGAGRQLEMIASTDVQVQYGPQNVTNMRCVVYEMETMTCTWQHPVSYNMEDTTVSVYFNSDKNFDQLQACPDLSFERCVWTSDNFSPVPYRIQINITNTVRHESAVQIFERDPNQLLKLARAEGLTLSPTSSQDCYTLTWTSKSFYNSTCRIQHTSKGHTDIKENVEAKRFELCGLKPYTSHSFSVSCTPSGLHSGFPSDPALYEYTTPEKEPSLGPEITNGSYSMTMCNNGRKSVTLYWKQVPEFARNGVIKNYTIDTGDMTEEVDAGKFEATVETDCNTSVIQLFAVNGAGMSTTPSVLQISNLTVPPNVEKTFSVFRNDANKTFQAVWESKKDNSTYTIFWCFRTSTSASCQSEMFWSLVPASLSDVEIPEPNLSPLIRVGISVFDGRQASGIFWAECSYIQNPNTVPAPVNLVAIPKESSALLYWNPAGCEENAVKVTKYLVKYRKDGGKANNYSTQTVPGNRNKFELSDLETDINYTIKVQSVSNSKPGEEAVTSVKISSPASALVIIMKVGGTLSASVAIVLLLLPLLKNFFRSRRKFKTLSFSMPQGLNDLDVEAGHPVESSTTSHDASTTQLTQHTDGSQLNQNDKPGTSSPTNGSILSTHFHGCIPSTPFLPTAECIPSTPFLPTAVFIPSAESSPLLSVLEDSSAVGTESYMKMCTKPDTSQELVGPQIYVDTVPAVLVVTKLTN
ncbi:oncostatin-M-specific receptor subunit beta-like [Physella acuta]|uniref:oncostatin-M-specific receptor subunit beta-like n=1 Tax=Physella acuta TaxID=109671 RepID=UPI0027DAC633|nr:oncostatin-M-specific receptor subunit beta-like [Physella acuta]